MIPIIGIALTAIAAVTWSATAKPAHRKKVMNELDKFSATAGLMSRLFTAVDAFRVIVAWTDTWKGQRVTSPPIGVPVPVQAAPPKEQTPDHRRLRAVANSDYDDDDMY